MTPEQAVNMQKGVVMVVGASEIMIRPVQRTISD